MRFVFPPNKIELIASIEFGNRTTEKFQFDHVPLPNQSNMIFGSVSFDWLRREKFTALQPDRKPGLFSDDWEMKKLVS